MLPIWTCHPRPDGTAVVCCFDTGGEFPTTRCAVLTAPTTEALQVVVSKLERRY